MTTTSDIAQMVARARAAQSEVARYSLDQIRDVCRSVGWQVYNDQNARHCAEVAVRETGMGRVEDKIAKHKTKVLGALADVLDAPTVGLVETDTARGIRKYAKPVGVVGALTPITNPTATLASNALSILAGRNAVVFGPHPRAPESAETVCGYMRSALSAVGAPEDLILHIPEPSREKSSELMRQVDLVVATGGASAVRAAYTSGTPAYGVGAGNPIAVVAEDADILEAAEMIVLSKSFDFGTSCSSENSVVVEASVVKRFLDSLRGIGVHHCTPAEKVKLENWLWIDSNGVRSLNPETHARSAVVIANDAGFQVSPETRALAVECDMDSNTQVWMGEKLAPVFAVWRYSGIRHAIELVKSLTQQAGRGHSCGLHTHCEDYIQLFAESLDTSRLMIRQPMAPANGGNFFNGMPSTTSLGCGTWAGNITTENIHWKHFVNLTWVSEPIEYNRPSEERVWGEFWNRYGR